MTSRSALGLAMCAVVGVTAGGAAAGALSIHDIQYTTAADGASPQAGTVVDCAGGIVTHKWAGGQLRFYLQDPARSDWAGIMLKDWTGGDVYDNVAAGDWVSLTKVYVEEHRGNTILKYHADYGSGYKVEGRGNALPAPVVVPASAVAAPAEGPPGEWYVADHAAEKYEHMLLTVEDVTVTAVDLGKAVDNYSLRDAAGGDCWAADYMNSAVGADGYHPYVRPGAAFDSVTGIFEQYAHAPGGWDYYQLVTTRTADLVPEPASLALLAGAAAALLARLRIRSRR